jgi:pimeloyl-ACP methyl ester carboxylesterase
MDFRTAGKMSQVLELGRGERIRGLVKKFRTALIIFAGFIGDFVVTNGFPGLIFDKVKQLILWQSGLEKIEIQVDDHRWVYLDGGAGEPILLVHGFGAGKDQWGFFPKAFTPSYRLIVPDLPGFGESSRLDSATYDIASQVKRLSRFVETLGLQSFHLLGISMGGYVAAYYASEHPDRVKSLALMGAAGVRARVESYAWKRYREEGRIILLYKTVAELEELISALFYDPPFLIPSFKRYFVEKGRLNYHFHEKILRDMEKGGMNLLEGRLAKVEAKSLIIWGANDQILHVSSVERFQRQLKDSRTVILENCGHVPYFEREKTTIRVYKEFIASIPEG